MAKANGKIQKDQLFIRGRAISGAPIIIGIIQLAKPTKAGITAPNTMIKAMDGGHLVEEVRIDNLQTRLVQLGTNDHRHEAADQEHDEGEPQVHRTDVFVVGGVQPAGDARWLVIVMIVCRRDVYQS